MKRIDASEIDKFHHAFLSSIHSSCDLGQNHGDND